MTETVREAERAAEKLLEGWWTNLENDRPLPVDPMLLAGRLGIRVERSALPPDVSGIITMPAGGIPVISLNRLDSVSRQRFTCAHEIGHYLRRQEGGDYEASFTDYRDTLAGLGVDAEEVYANQFAAALLMPAHLVRTLFAGDVEELARRFGTSAQAMTIRLRNLRIL